MPDKPAPLNYTTKIDPLKTMGEVMGILSAHGASAITTTYSDGAPTGVSFVLDTPYGPRHFLLPVNAEGTKQALIRAHRNGIIRVSQSGLSTAQAHRVAWRVVKDWVEAQMALVDSGQAEVDQVMLPYLATDDGTPLYAAYVATQQLQLESSGG